MTGLSDILEAPYFAVVMKSSDAASDLPEPAAAMVALATRQPGFLGLETAEENDGRPVTVSYWQDQESIARWKAVGARLIDAEATTRQVERACEMRTTLVAAEPVSRDAA